MNSSKTLATTYMVVHTTRHASRNNFWFVHTHTDRQTDMLKTIPAYAIAASD